MSDFIGYCKLGQLNLKPAASLLYNQMKGHIVLLVKKGKLGYPWKVKRTQNIDFKRVTDAKTKIQGRF